MLRTSCPTFTRCGIVVVNKTLEMLRSLETQASRDPKSQVLVDHSRRIDYSPSRFTWIPKIHLACPTSHKPHFTGDGHTKPILHEVFKTRWQTGSNWTGRLCREDQVSPKKPVQSSLQGSKVEGFVWEGSAACCHTWMDGVRCTGISCTTGRKEANWVFRVRWSAECV